MWSRWHISAKRINKQLSVSDVSNMGCSSLMPWLQRTCKRLKLFIALPARACSHMLIPLTLSWPVLLAHFRLRVWGEVKDARRWFVIDDASLCPAVVCETFLRPSVTWNEVSRPNGGEKKEDKVAWSKNLNSRLWWGKSASCMDSGGITDWGRSARANLGRPSRRWE